MILAKKANRVIEIAPEKVKEYKELGYTVIQDGNVIYKPETDSKVLAAKLENAQETADKTIEELNRKVAELEAAVAEKDKTIEELKAKATAASTKKPEEASKAAK